MGAKASMVSEFEELGWSDMISQNINTKRGAQVLLRFSFCFWNYTKIYLTEESYYNFTENLLQSTMLFFIMVCFQISFLIFTGGSNSQNEQSLQLAREFESRRSKMEIRFLGSRPSSDGKWESWAQTTDSNPYPMKYTLRPLTELFTERNFVGTIAWKYTNIYD